ncbi:MAG TPA: ribokinase [Streptosporangiaceae bacterium]
MPMTARVTVLGSMNMDISVTVPELPGPGATVLGSPARFAPGGKGGNQAVAAARLGAEVRMAGCVGRDDFGARLLGALRAEAVDTTAVRQLPGVASGLALITVDASGENMITVAPGANEATGADEVSSATAHPVDVLIVSAEIPFPAIRAALEQARGSGTTCLLNLAPVPRDAHELLAAGVDWLVVNETEASAILGRPVSGLAGAAAAATSLLSAGAAHAVVTAGAAGAAYAGPAGADSVPGFPVTAVDSVGAGDTFVGALAAAVGAGAEPGPAVRAACAAAAVATTRPGTQDAMPRPADLPVLTGVSWPLTP